MERTVLKRLSASTVLGVISLTIAMFALIREEHPRFVGTASAAAACADVDGDGMVQLIDAVIVADHYGVNPWLDPPFNTVPNPAFAPQTDLTKNGVVNIKDVIAVVNQFDTTTPCQTNSYPKVLAPGGRMVLDSVGESTALKDPGNLTRSVLVGDTFHVSLHLGLVPTPVAAVGYQARIHWDEAVLDLVPRNSGTNDVLLENGGFTGSFVDWQQLGPADNGAGSDAYIAIMAFDTFGWDSAPNTVTIGALNPPVSQFEFVCQTTGTASLTLEGGGRTGFADRPNIEYNAPTLVNAQVECVTDGDGDRIQDQIDTLPLTPSTGFSDVPLGGTTTGTITTLPVTMTLSVTEEAGLLSGVRIGAAGTGGPAVVTGAGTCNPSLAVNLSPGDNIKMTCASADAQAGAGSPVVWLGSLIARLSSSADVSVTEPSPGVYDVANIGESDEVVGGLAIAGGTTATGVVDTDGDGLADAAETGSIGSSPSIADTDSDGLGDGAEYVLHGTDPLLADTDGDGCPESNEVGMNPLQGGQRDPLNPHDYFNPSHDGVNRVDDILLVVDAYFIDDSDGNPGLPPYAPGYSPDTDRTLIGPLAWNLGPPNGLQRVDDILNQLHQYFHDCS